MNPIRGSMEDMIRFHHNTSTLEDEEFVQMIQTLASNVHVTSGFQTFRRAISKALWEVALSSEEPELSEHIRTTLPKRPIESASHEPSSVLCRLPLDLSYEINRFLDLKSVLRLGNTCRYLYILSHHRNSITHLHVENDKMLDHFNELHTHDWKIESLVIEDIDLTETTHPIYDFLNNCRKLSTLQVDELFSSTPSPAISFPPKLTSVAIKYYESGPSDWPLFNWEESSNLEQLEISWVVVNLSVVERVLSKLRNLTHLTCSFWEESDEVPSRQQMVDCLGNGLRNLSFINIQADAFRNIQSHLWNICITRQDILEEVRLQMEDMYAEELCDMEPLFADWHTTEIKKLSVEDMGGVRNFQWFCTHVLRMANVNRISLESEASCVPLYTFININGYKPSHGTVIAKSLQVSFEFGHRYLSQADLLHFCTTVDKVLDLIWCLLSADHLPKANISLRMEFHKSEVYAGWPQKIPFHEEFSRVHSVVKSECKGRGIPLSSDLRPIAEKGTHGWGCCFECVIG